MIKKTTSKIRVRSEKIRELSSQELSQPHGGSGPLWCTLQKSTCNDPDIHG